MKRFTGYSVTWPVRIFLCFVCGILAGTGTAVLLGEEILGRLEELDILALDPGSRGRAVSFQKYWEYLLQRRFAGFFWGGLVFTTPLAFWAGMLLLFCAGFYGALSISVFTLETGWRGIFLFLRSVLPQWLLYGAVWVLLIYASSKGTGKLRFRIWLLLAAAVVLGSLLEAIFQFFVY